MACSPSPASLLCLADRLAGLSWAGCIYRVCNVGSTMDLRDSAVWMGILAFPITPNRDRPANVCGRHEQLLCRRPNRRVVPVSQQDRRVIYRESDPETNMLVELGGGIASPMRSAQRAAHL